MEKLSAADERIESLFHLHWTIISIFFKGFDDKADLPEGLNFTHMKAAMTLRFHGSMPMSEISSRLALEKGSFTPVANRLIEKGFVRKERSKSDRRVYNLALTEAGIKLTDKLKTDHDNYVQSMLQRLNAEERDEFFEHLHKLNILNDKIKEGGK